MNALLKQMQIWVAHSSVASSTVRGHERGLVRKLRTLLADVDLKRFAACHPSKFEGLLDAETTRIYRKMPTESRHWGIARKVLNIFLRCATYNFLLRDAFQLDRLEAYLELPLDSLTANGLKRLSPRGTLPRWKGVQRVTPVLNECFQRQAKVLAVKRDVHRVHLDLFLWLDR